MISSPLGEENVRRISATRHQTRSSIRALLLLLGTMAMTFLLVYAQMKLFG